MIEEVLQSLRETTSTTAKKNVLKSALSCDRVEQLKTVFKLTYDRFIVFGITSFEDVECNGVSNEAWFDSLFDALYALSNKSLTGNAARQSIQHVVSKGDEFGKELASMILKRDLRIGAGVRLINSVFPGLLPEDFCMSANKYDSDRVTFPCYADRKLDGVRCIASFGDDSVTLFSRNGKEFRNYVTIESELLALKGFFAGDKLDGEVTLGHFQDLMRTVGRRDEGIELAKDAVYNIFDIPSDKPFSERLTLLNLLDDEIHRLGLKHVKVVDGEVIEDEDALSRFYTRQIDEGYEGAIVKTLDGKYEFKRGWGWQKMKPEHTEDLTVVGYEEGRGKYEGQLGALVVRTDSSDEDVHVGSGFSDDDRQSLWQKRDALIGNVVEVKFQEKTKGGSLRFPVFIRFRPDKTE